MSNFFQIHPVAAKLLHADGLTDIKKISSFASSAKALKIFTELQYG
jgi:hypothetical protein